MQSTNLRGKTIRNYPSTQSAHTRTAKETKGEKLKLLKISHLKSPWSSHGEIIWIQLYNILRKRNLRCGKGNFFPSKVQRFHSFQRQHMRHERAVVQSFPLPFQEANIAIIELGISQVTPNRHDGKSHNSLAIIQ